MKAYVGITDWDWFDLLRELNDVSEVNFWQPSGNKMFRALEPGQPFLFKLHSPRNFIVGGGFFAHSTILPVSLAWDAFGVANGATDLAQMRERIEKYRRSEASVEDYSVGCVLLESPFFFDKDDWIPVPGDWSPNIVQGKGYDLHAEPGKSMWQRVISAIHLPSRIEATAAAAGAPYEVYPRVGQGSFRVMVTDAYTRRCAVTRERTLPALDAAHIIPYSEENGYRVHNGILLRKDVHALFDRGYVTVSPDYRVEVSRRIREEFKNGKDYYRLHGSEILLPGKAALRPSRESLEWHNENVFLG